jgi:hypothetical protein
MVVGLQSASAYISGIAIQTEKNSSMQVYVNGKLRTSQAKSFVRIKGNPGLYHVMVKVLNPYDKEWYLVRKDVRVDKGYEFYYKVNFSKGKRPVLELIRRYPVYSNYFLNSSLYNRHFISSAGFRVPLLKAKFRGVSSSFSVC